MADDLMLLEIRKNLKEQQIEYQIKIINNNLRLSLNNLDGQYISLNRDKNIKNYYKILFKKESFWYPEAGAILYYNINKRRMKKKSKIFFHNIIYK